MSAPAEADWRIRVLRGVFSASWLVGIATAFGLFGDRHYLFFVAAWVGLASMLAATKLEKPDFPKGWFIYFCVFLAAVAIYLLYQFLFQT